VGYRGGYASGYYEDLVASGIPSEETVGTPTLAATTDWWAANYVYRRSLAVKSLVETLPIHHPVYVQLNHDLHGQGKTRDDGQDVEIVYKTDDQLTWIGRSLWMYDDHIEFEFGLVEPLVAGSTALFYVYYGNPDGEGFDRPSSSTTNISISYDDPRVAYTRPTQDWQDGVTSVKGAQASFTFQGTSIAPVIILGPTSPLVMAQIDEDPWREINLYYPVELAVPYLLSSQLTQERPHRVRIQYPGLRQPQSRGDQFQLHGFSYNGALNIEVGPEEVLATKWRGGGVGGGSA
jgi:hypothetical protein